MAFAVMRRDWRVAWKWGGRGVGRGGVIGIWGGMVVVVLTGLRGVSVDWWLGYGGNGYLVGGISDANGGVCTAQGGRSRVGAQR